MRILISAGEASGEMYGADIIRALRRRLPDVQTAGISPVPTAAGYGTATVEFFGVGGERMRSAGCEIVIDAKELSVVGITEILGHLAKIWGLFHKLIAEADKRRPDLAIVIDSPAFNWRVAREMKKRGVPVIYYVAPQFWAWRQGRVRLLRKYVDKALVIFPFEEKFYRDRGVDAEFVGHPLAELPHPPVSREKYAAENGLDAAKPWITLMPGSRRKEVQMNLPEMLWAAELLGREYNFVLPVAPTISKTLITEIMSKLGNKATASLALTSQALPALAHSRAAMVASGTATVEAAMMETPFVMVYRVTALSYLLGRWMIKVPHFAMVNLIAGEQVVPELVQQEFTRERVVAELQRISPDGPAREKMLVGLRNVKQLLQAQSGEDAPDRAADAIVRFLHSRAGGRQATAQPHTA